MKNVRKHEIKKCRRAKFRFWINLGHFHAAITDIFRSITLASFLLLLD